MNSNFLNDLNLLTDVYLSALYSFYLALILFYIGYSGMKKDDDKKEKDDNKKDGE